MQTLVPETDAVAETGVEPEAKNSLLFTFQVAAQAFDADRENPPVFVIELFERSRN